MNRIRTALGAALAEESIGSVREFEVRLARALDDLTDRADRWSQAQAS
jgi:hypothetical protein